MGQWIVRTNDCKENSLLALVEPCNRQSLLPVALKRLGLFWSAALVSVLIPVFHFVLVPLFLLIGIIAFFRTLKFKFKVSQGAFVCPNCTEKNNLKTIWFQDEFRTRCEKCQQQIVVLEK